MKVPVQAVVAGIEGVDALTPSLKAETHGVGALGPDQLCPVLDDGIGEQLVVRRAKVLAKLLFEKVMGGRKSCGTPGIPTWFGQMRQAIASVAVVDENVVHADTNIVHQRGADGAGLIEHAIVRRVFVEGVVSEDLAVVRQALIEQLCEYLPKMWSLSLNAQSIRASP